MPIAAKYYGNGADYNKIFNANTDKISNPNLIYVGPVSYTHLDVYKRQAQDSPADEPEGNDTPGTKEAPKGRKRKPNTD